MNPEWNYGLCGVLLISLAGAVLLLGNTCVMGPSGVRCVLLDGSASAAAERLAFLAAPISVPAILVGAGPGHAFAPVAGLGVMILAGLLVGFGTRLGNGCAAGHGVCGIPGLSRRGIVATQFYLLAGGAAVVLARAQGWA